MNLYGVIVVTVMIALVFAIGINTERRERRAN